MSTKSNSFITNESENTLLNEFNILLKDTEFFDCLVGYFYVSGFYKLQKSLENTKQIRILVGMGIDSQTFNLIEDSQNTIISTAEYKKQIEKDLINEMNNSEDTIDVEKGIKQFVSWLKSGKLEIRGYKERKTHSKLYIMTFDNDDRDIGRVITGSSNFTQPGLERNLEFNVELREPENYEFASDKFNQLWEDSEPISQNFINTITNKTWIKEDITPYELYLKFIYEFLKDKIWNDKKELDYEIFPEGFKMLEYQRDAVLYARDILQEHGGVFLSDVVGLGKTYMGSLLAQQLRGKTLVIAPPALVKEHNPGGWKRVLREFGVSPMPIVESKGKLDEILKNYDVNSYQNVIIDESHDFKNEDTQQYEYLSKICKGKKIILISATPFNNSPSDLLSQIKLFQPAHNSTLPNPKVRDLEAYFKRQELRQKSIDRSKHPDKYMEISKKISAEIRDDVLKYIMVRRTRKSISKYYSKDLKKNNMEFPNVEKPKPIHYHFDETTNEIFDNTLYKLTKKLTYAKYRPLANEYRVNPDTRYANSQKMMGNFIKILLIKRLESGSYAFKKSVQNSINTHQQALDTLNNKGVFYTSRDYNLKILDLVAEDDFNNIEELIEEGKANEYYANDFAPKFKEDLKNDLNILKEIAKMWESVENYPKRIALTNLLNEDLKNKKVIIFTEFIDTAEDIAKLISKECKENVKVFTGKSGKEDMDDILYNFDANIDKNKQKNEYRILITTDTLSHGVNLHRSNVIINFDIPWNPTRMMQRVGRVQRLGTKFKHIYTYNFFPASPIEKNIQLQSLAEGKIAMFIELLGNDSQLLTEEPVKSYDDYFNILSSNIDDEEVVDDELKYLREIRDIRDNNPELFKKIEELPIKSRVARASEQKYLITLMKKDKFKKLFKSKGNISEEIDFFEAIKELKADEYEKAISIDDEFYDYLYQNMFAFEQLLNNPDDDIKLSNNEKFVIKYIKYARSCKNLLNHDKNYLGKIKELIEEGHITKSRAKKIKNELIAIDKNNKDLDKIKRSNLIVQVFNDNILDEDLKTETASCIKECKEKPEQIILSEYFL
ncbi:helicase-related protein [uncultured Methanobrevibacter sp.]|uniref:helicase-related protein n=1 Tax=uncultured Methanobrevibacter sp. TaxID=253161 RepID=UPI0025E75F15|nr:helicase-related protein [uncultured Methanobrevibacter sp.]